MSGRDIVLARIARALGRPDRVAEVSIDDQPAAVTHRINAPTRSTLPAVSGELVDTLITRMEAVLMSVVRLQSVEDCIAAVDWYLESQQIDVASEGSVTVSPELSGLAWPENYRTGRASGVEKVSITPCRAAVAETGSVVTGTGPKTPSTLNFLPETHIIVVYESQVVRHVDDVFDVLRQAGELPRAVNFVTGPSRTADIEQTLEIGAHGPRRMHVLLVAGEPTHDGRML